MSHAVDIVLSESVWRKTELLRTPCRVVWLVLISVLLPSCAATSKSMNAQRWLEDLDVLSREIPKRHVSPETERSSDDFQTDVAQLRSRIPSLPREAIVMEFARLAASFGDSHTELPLAQQQLAFHRYPIGLYHFSGDLRVIVVAEGHEELLGARLVRVGEHAIDQILDAIKPVIADDFGNPYEFLHSGPAFVMIPEVLIGLGLAPPGNAIPYVFEHDHGERATETFEAIPLQDVAQAMTIRQLRPEEEPLFMRDRNFWYAMDRVESTEILYVRASRSQNQSGKDSLASFARRVSATMREPGVSGVVVDLRQNTGGNFNRTEALATTICDARRHGDISRVYVILGRHTYSAAIILAAQLKHGCEAMFVGEVPRAVPNRQADVGRFTLPNSRLEVTYSNRLRHPFPELGDALEIPLDLVALPTWESYRAGIDPAMDVILSSAASR